MSDFAGGHDTPQIAIVTGGGTGIGAAVARRISEAGWRVIVTGRREAPLREVARQTGASVLVGDVSAEGHAAAVVRHALELPGRLDGLVLNAGIAPAGSVLTTSSETWQETLDVNLTGPFLLARAALPHLLETRGAIVAVGSIAAEVAGPDLAAYGVAKAGLVRLIRSIAVDFGPAGLRANTVNPGWIRSEMADREMGALATGTSLDLEDALLWAARQTIPLTSRCPVLSVRARFGRETGLPVRAQCAGIVGDHVETFAAGRDLEL